MFLQTPGGIGGGGVRGSQIPTSFEKYKTTGPNVTIVGTHVCIHLGMDIMLNIITLLIPQRDLFCMLGGQKLIRLENYETGVPIGTNFGTRLNIHLKNKIKCINK